MRMEGGCFCLFKNNNKTIKACKIRAVCCKVGFPEPFPPHCKALLSWFKAFWVALLPCLISPLQLGGRTMRFR